MKITKSVFTILAGLALCLACSTFPASPACAKTYVVEPLLVPQPSFAGMTFHVYKPYNLPANWYATFDGYPVTKNKDGTWVYGTYSGAGLIPTHFIVGSVVPSMAGLVPYVEPIEVSSATTLSHPPVPPVPLAVHEGYEGIPAAYAQPDAPQPLVAQQPSMMVVPEGPAMSTYMPDWLFNDRFLALGNWKSTVDRMGVLHKPSVPVAWLGDSPRVIYAWNGRNWEQMMARDGERPVDILLRNLYKMTRQAHRTGLVLHEGDVPLMAQQAANWGYYWMGEIFPGWSERR